MPLTLAPCGAQSQGQAGEVLGGCLANLGLSDAGTTVDLRPPCPRTVHNCLSPHAISVAWVPKPSSSGTTFRHSR
jgi:hypothetical protein